MLIHKCWSRCWEVTVLSIHYFTLSVQDFPGLSRGQNTSQRRRSISSFAVSGAGAVPGKVTERSGWDCCQKRTASRQHPASAAVPVCPLACSHRYRFSPGGGVPRRASVSSRALGGRGRGSLCRDCACGDARAQRGCDPAPLQRGWHELLERRRVVLVLPLSGR